MYILYIYISNIYILYFMVGYVTQNIWSKVWTALWSNLCSLFFRLCVLLGFAEIETFETPLEQRQRYALKQ